MSISVIYRSLIRSQCLLGNEPSSPAQLSGFLLQLPTLGDHFNGTTTFIPLALNQYQMIHHDATQDILVLIARYHNYKVNQ